LDIMRKNNISQLLVTDQQEYVGIIHLHDLVREGII
jgi:arabinose-5-phosphate isomerase